MGRKMFLSIGECMIEMAALEGGDFRLGFAGDTMNTAWYARAVLDETRWNIAYHTRLGTDPYSDKMLAFFSENGIDTAFIQRDPERRPGLYLIEIADGERSFTYWRDLSAAKNLAADRAALTGSLDAADFIYFSGISMAILPPNGRTTLLEELRSARLTGKRIAFDPNLRPRLWISADEMRRTIMQAASVADIVLPSYDDEASIFGDTDLEACAARYAAVGARLVVVKNGGGEMLVREGGEISRIDGVERVKPVDTTGAGDSFNGGFLAALAEGASPADAARLGHAVSLRVIMHRGALLPMQALLDLRAQ